MPVPVELLEAFPFLRGIGNAAAEVAEACQEQSFPAGTILCQVGKDADTVYFLLAGRVDDVTDGVVFAAHVARDVFGQSALFVTSSPGYHCEVIEPCRCLTIPVERLRSLLGRYSKLALNFLRLYAWRLQVAVRFGLSLGALAPDAIPQDEVAPIARLKMLSIFAGIEDDSFLQRLAANLKPLEFLDGDRIETRGDKDGQLHIIIGGEASAQSDQREVARLRPGDTVGLLPLLSGEPAETDVVAVGGCQTQSLARSHLYAALSQSPSLCVNFLRALVLRTEEAVRAAVASADPASKRPTAAYLEAPWEEASPTSWRPPEKAAPAKPVPATAALAVTSAEGTTGLFEHSDDFAKALRVQQEELVQALTALVPGGAGGALVNDIYAALRSPIYPPKQGVRVVAGALAAPAPRELRLRGVLASPTAVDELPDFLALAGLFRRHDVRVDLSFLLVRWENLVDLRGRSVAERNKLWAAQVEAVRTIVGTEGTVVTVDVRLGEEDGAVFDPPDVRAEYEALRATDGVNLATATDLPSNALRLTKDLVWTKQFYLRQKSLCRLGPAQPLLDLAIRRAVGRRFSDEIGGPEATPMAMITSELNQRFLPCYDATPCILNIAVGCRVDLVPLQLRTINAQGDGPTTYSGWVGLQAKSGAILRLLESVFPDLSSWFDFSALSQVREKAIAVVAEDQDKVVGFAYARQESLVNGREGKDKWILNVLAAASTGTGIGSKLMIAVKQLVLINGARCLYTNTDPTRVQTMNFYKKHGFFDDGSVGHYYYNGPAVWMWSDLKEVREPSPLEGETEKAQGS